MIDGPHHPVRSLCLNHSVKMTRSHVRIHSFAEAKVDFSKPPISLFPTPVSHFRANYTQLHERFPDRLTLSAKQSPLHFIILLSPNVHFHDTRGHRGRARVCFDVYCGQIVLRIAPSRASPTDRELCKCVRVECVTQCE